MLEMTVPPVVSPTAAPGAAASTELADFEAYEAQLKTQIEGFSTLRHQVRWFPLFALLTAPIGLLYAKWAPFAIVGIWLIFWGSTLYITWMRTWQYKGELKRIHSEVARLRSALRKADDPSGARADATE